MKHLKKFDDMVNESTLYSKAEIINLLLIEMDAHIYGEDELRDELAKLPSNKFEDLVNQYGYKEFRTGFWTPDYSKKKKEHSRMRPE